ncbi:MAG: B12-binding domain-containing radical SAM protein [Desulfuromonas sp.]|nr:MAG: B12-binding domain-containing radical SAM protein [Desulfuromonas sp.]
MSLVLITGHLRRSPQATPLAAASLVAALDQRQRRQAHLLNLYAPSEVEAAVTELTASPPQIISFTLTTWNRSWLLAMARKLRQKLPETLLIAGGPEATAAPAEVLAEGELNAVIRGEGEIPFRQIVSDRFAGRPLAAAPGVMRHGDREEPAFAPLPDLDTLDSPWLSGILTPPRDGGLLWEVARGCSFACSFCFDGRGQKGVRPFPRQRLAAEIELFVKQGVGQVWVLDSTFNAPPERGKSLLRLLAERAPQIHFHLEAKADFLDKETAQLLSRLTCSLQLGLQSLRPEVMRQVRRPITPEGLSKKIRPLQQHGITYGFDLIYGLPGDDHAGFCQTLDEALSLEPNHLEIFPLALLPGTPLAAEAGKFGLRAATNPPYEISASTSYSAADLAASRTLAATTQLFYNIGRAVAFFPTLLQSLETTPSALFSDFGQWLQDEQNLPLNRLLALETWSPQQLLPLQIDYLGKQLKKRKRGRLRPPLKDLLTYHFHYAETVLGADTLPPPRSPGDCWDRPLHLAPAVHLVSFAYEILDLLEMGEPDLEQIFRLFRPVGSTALFLRRNGEVICESLEEEMRRLLLGCDGKRSPKEIFAGAVREDVGREIVAFAVDEGILVPCRSGNNKRTRQFSKRSMKPR